MHSGDGTWTYQGGGRLLSPPAMWSWISARTMLNASRAVPSKSAKQDSYMPKAAAEFIKRVAYQG